VEAFRISLLIALPWVVTCLFDLTPIKKAVIMDRQYIVFPPEEGRDKLEKMKKGDIKSVTGEEGKLFK